MMRELKGISAVPNIRNISSPMSLNNHNIRSARGLSAAGIQSRGAHLMNRVFDLPGLARRVKNGQ